MKKYFVPHKEVLKLREERYSLDEIGKMFSVTRERIRQILKKHNADGRIKLASHDAVWKEYHCKNCGQSFKKRRSFIHEPLFCGNACYYAWVGRNKEKNKEARRLKHIKAVLKWRATHKEQYNKWYKPYIKKWREKNRKKLLATTRWRYQFDPVFREKTLAAARKWYHENKKRAETQTPML